MKKLLTAIGVTIICQSAIAVDLELSIGNTHYKNYSDTLWRTPGFPREMDSSSLGGELALSKNIWKSDDYGVNLRASYVYLGTMGIDAIAPSQPTSTAKGTTTVQGKWVGYDFLGARPNNPCDGPCENLLSFKGTGHDMGFTLQLEPYFKYKGYQIGINGGFYKHRITFSEKVSNLDSSVGSGFQDTEVSSESVWSMGRVLGVSVVKDNLTARIQYFKTPLLQNIPQAWNGVWMFSVGYKF